MEGFGQCENSMVDNRNGVKRLLAELHEKQLEVMRRLIHQRVEEEGDVAVPSMLPSVG